MSALVLQMIIYLPVAFALYWMGGWKVKLSSVLIGIWAVLSGAAATELLPLVREFLR